MWKHLKRWRKHIDSGSDDDYQPDDIDIAIDWFKEKEKDEVAANLP